MTGRHGVVRDERGSAVVEFVVLGVLMLIPLVYLVMMLARVQAGSYAVSQAAREAGRAYVTAEAGDQAAGRAEAAARIAFLDHSFEESGRLAIACDGIPCLRPDGHVETTATVSFTDAIDGVTVSLRMTSDSACPDCKGTGGKPGTKPHVCPECDGAGFVVASAGGAFSINETCPRCGGRQLVYDEPCPTCQGSGRGVAARTIQARIPAGVKDGQRIRLRGKGAPGEQGGPAGDLYVTVKVRPHRLFGRKDDNLTLDVPVSFDELALGAEIKLPTLGGAPVTLKIPAGTPNGRTFRVRGRGAPKSDGTRGDLLATVEVQVPAVVDGPAREAIEAYRASMAGKPLRSRLFED